MINHVIFTKRAFNAIITETIDKDPVETGGIFIGYILDNGICIVVETIPPGIKTINHWAYFEYDASFVNYLSNVIAKQYVGNLNVLGLWHRHPGSMDTFSSTDDDTNVMFARSNGQYGAISVLVNCDPKLRLTVYHVDGECHYTKLDWSVDDGIIPANLLQLHYESADNLPVLNDGQASVPEEQPAASGTPEENAGQPDGSSPQEQNQEQPQSPERETEPIPEGSNVLEADVSPYTLKNAFDDFCVILKKLLK